MIIIDKIYLYVKNPNDTKYQYLIKKRENNGFIEYSNNMHDVYKNIEEENPSIECNVLTVFDYMITNMISRKNTEFNGDWTIYQRTKTKYIDCFYCTILFLSSKKCWTKFYILFYYENPKKTRAWKNCI